MHTSAPLESSRALSYPDLPALRQNPPTRALVVSNEIASPLYGPDCSEGNFGSLTRRLAETLAPHGIGVYAHERLGSADQTYNRNTATRLAPHNRAKTLRAEARKIASDIRRIFPTAQAVDLFGHSAGGMESIDLTRALHEDEQAAARLGKVSVGHLVVFDPPRHSHLFTATGIARYLTYLPYGAVLPVPPRSPAERTSATRGLPGRFLADTCYNATAWTQGVLPNLTYAARQMPETAIHVAIARHSPNNIAHFGPQWFAETVRHLRKGMAPGAAPCDAEIYPGPHAGGSRLAVIINTLAHAGLIGGAEA